MADVKFVYRRPDINFTYEQGGTGPDVGFDVLGPGDFESQCDIVSDTPDVAAERMWAFSSTVNIVSDTPDDLHHQVDRRLWTTIDMVVNTYCYGNAERPFDSQSDIIFNTYCYGNAERPFISQIDLTTFSPLVQGQAERPFASQSDIVSVTPIVWGHQICYVNSQVDIVTDTPIFHLPKWNLFITTIPIEVYHNDTWVRVDRFFWTTINLLSGAVTRLQIEGQFSSQVNIISETPDDIPVFNEHWFETLVEIETNTFCAAAVDKVFNSTANIVSNTPDIKLSTGLRFATEVNIVSNTVSDAEAIRKFGSVVAIVSNTSDILLFTDNMFSSEVNIETVAMCKAYAIRRFASSLDILYNTHSETQLNQYFTSNVIINSHTPPIDCEVPNLVTDFIEVDPSDSLTVTPNKVAFDTVYRWDDGYVYKDYGVDYWDEFIYKFELEIFVQSDTSFFWPAAMTNALGPWQDTKNFGSFVGWRRTGWQAYPIGSVDLWFTVLGSMVQTRIASGSPYPLVYFTWERKDGVSTVYVYEDADRTIPVLDKNTGLPCSTYLTQADTTLYRYAKAWCGYNDPNYVAPYISGYVQNQSFCFPGVLGNAERKFWTDIRTFASSTSNVGPNVERKLASLVNLKSSTSEPAQNQDRNFGSVVDIVFNTEDSLAWELATLANILRSVPESKTDDIDAASEVNIIEAQSETDDYDVECLK